MRPYDVPFSLSWVRPAGGWCARATMLVAALAAPVAFAQEKPQAQAPRQLSLENKPWKGDFDQILERRMIRVLIPYSRSLFFNDKGRERGIAAENMRDFERYLNRKYAKELGKRPLTIHLVATTRDKLFTQLNEGLGDIALGNLTETDDRKKLVDFVAPRDIKPVKELLAMGPKAPEIKTLDDLSGKTVRARPSSSYAESLAALNTRLQAAGKPPVKIGSLPDALEDEDALEMLNVGLLDFVVVDDWKGRMWAQVLPNITVREDLVLREDAYTGWAVRKGSPKLQAAILDFYVNFFKKEGVLAYRKAEYHKNVKEISNNSGGAAMKRFQDTIALFEKYGQKYGFDPLMLAAQGYQESQLRQDAKSHVGAIGVMQVMPATGQSLNVGDIRSIEPNIHAGTKYMDQLMTKYFLDAKFDDQNRSLFAFAAYNAGPGNISKMRKLAATRGLDPDKWFNNVEIVTAEKIGIEATTYVRNIYKYYVAYKLTQEAQAAQRSAREQVAPATK
jgi:membrane-bound lytic murein transglycosylase MltF